MTLESIPHMKAIELPFLEFRDQGSLGTQIDEYLSYNKLPLLPDDQHNEQDRIINKVSVAFADRRMRPDEVAPNVAALLPSLPGLPEGIQVSVRKMLTMALINCGKAGAAAKLTQLAGSSSGSASGIHITT